MYKLPEKKWVKFVKQPLLTKLAICTKDTHSYYCHQHDSQSGILKVYPQDFGLQDFRFVQTGLENMQCIWKR